MAKISLRQLLDHAAEYDYGVPAFNINNMEQGLAVMQAAEHCASPVIMQATGGARRYAGDTVLFHMIEGFVKAYPEVPICLHQDHGSHPEICRSAIAGGFTSVMMDGSLEADGKTPADYEYNVAVTREVVNFAHKAGVSVEAELGVLGSLETGQGAAEDGHGAEGTLSQDQLLTDPEQAADFVARTGCDALAIACGTSHGAYKFSRRPDGDILAVKRIEEIHRRLPHVHLVMHGASSVSQELQDLLNQYGGDIPQTYGVPISEICRAIRSGVRKINIDTDCRMAMAAAIRRVIATEPQEFDLRKFMKPALQAMRDIIENRFDAFGSVNMAKKIKPLPLYKMAQYYNCP